MSPKSFFAISFLCHSLQLFAIKFVTLNHGSQLLSDSWFDRQDSHPPLLFYCQIWTQPESCKEVKYLRNISKPWSLKTASFKNILGNMGCALYLKPCIPHHHFLFVSSTALFKSVLPVQLGLKARLKELCQESLSNGWDETELGGKTVAGEKCLGCVPREKGFFSGMSFSIYEVAGLPTSFYWGINKPTMRLTNHAEDLTNTEKPCQKENLCLRGIFGETHVSTRKQKPATFNSRVYIVILVV